LVVIPGLIALMLWGLNLSIDFTGGSRITLSFAKTVDTKMTDEAKKILSDQKIQVATIEQSNNLIFIRTNPIDQNQNNKFINTLSKSLIFRESEFETVGPTIGNETTINAAKAIAAIAPVLVLRKKRNPK